MVWRRTRESDAAAAPAYMRLPQEYGGEEEVEETKITKGYVPMMVGGKGGDGERVLVHVRMLSEPCVAALLEMAAQQFGYRQQGVLRIPCDVHDFRRIVGEAYR